MTESRQSSAHSREQTEQNRAGWKCHSLFIQIAGRALFTHTDARRRFAVGLPVPRLPCRLGRRGGRGGGGGGNPRLLAPPLLIFLFLFFLFFNLAEGSFPRLLDVNSAWQRRRGRGHWLSPPLPLLLVVKIIVIVIVIVVVMFESHVGIMAHHPLASALVDGFETLGVATRAYTERGRETERQTQREREQNKLMSGQRKC
jgi:hypothetical protein